jgi:probable rRNA maturation factor
MAKINFHNQDIKFTLPHPRKTSNWIQSVVKKEKRTLKELNYIFCSDESLIEINIQFLNHRTFTDIITFDNSESLEIEADIFISIDRVKDNSEKLKVPFDQEIHRVIVHGVLHLLGYSDKTLKLKSEMRKKEDAYLSLR